MHVRGRGRELESYRKGNFLTGSLFLAIMLLGKVFELIIYQ